MENIFERKDVRPLFEELFCDEEKDLDKEVEQNLLNTVKALLSTIHNMNSKMLEHTYRVAFTSKRIAEKLVCDSYRLRTIVLGSLLHDIGVIGVSINCATEKEWGEKELKAYYSHSVIGKTIIEQIVPFTHTLPIIEKHHAYLNGMGHPCGMRGEDIPFEVRVVTVANDFDMMSEDFPWGKRYPLCKRIDEIKVGSPTLYDPRVVDAFLEVHKS